MPELGQTNFSAGWTPSSDSRNAPENGLLRMDNVTLDEEGVLTSIRGEASASENFGQEVRNLWSKRIFKGSTRYYRYAHLADGSVVSTSGGESDLTHPRQILTGGNEFIAAFGNSGEYALICSGEKKVKDDGATDPPKNLGIEKPTAAPTILAVPNNKIDLTDNYASFGIIAEDTGKQGTIVSAVNESISVRTNIDNRRAIIRSGGAFDFGNFSGGEKVDPYDKFEIRIAGSKEALYTYVTISFLTTPRPDPYNPNDLISNFNYTFVIEGNNVVQDFSILRSDFTPQVYEGSVLTWTDIKQIEITVSTSSSSETDEIRINQGRFITYKGNLSGTYQWVQVNGYKHPNSNKVSVSPVGIETDPIQLNNQRAKITPQLPTTWGDDTNVIWIFRREIKTFDSYYRSAVREDISQFEDTQTDRQIIGRVGPIERIDDDRTIIPVRIDWFVEHPPDNIIGIEGPYFGRTVYLTEDKIYLSRIDDPDCIDVRYTFDVSGNSSERNLWVTQVGDSRLEIGTNVDIYSLSGTMRSFEDGTIDALLRPYGVDSPPISRRVTSYEDNTIYMSKEGWRVLQGGSSLLITGQTSALYQERDLHGFSQIFVAADQSRRYDCCVSRSKLYCIVHHDLNTSNPLGRERTLLVYDFAQKYWRATDKIPTCLWAEEHGIVLAGFGNSYSSLDRPAQYALPNVSILVRSAFVYGGSPNNRKDVETLKIYADTNSQDVSVFLRVDGIDTLYSVGTLNTSGPSLRTFDIENIAGIPKGKSYSLELSAENLTTTFKLFYWNINFSPRPEQKNYQRVPPTNFGVAGRKRFYDLPFSLDTLGNNVEVSPVLDGVALTPQNFTGSGKGKEFFTIAFPEEVIGHELGLELRSNGDGVFEFYEMIQPRHTELLPDLQKFFHIPFTNLGTPGKKRFIRFAFVIDTRGNTLKFTPTVDGVSYAPMSFSTPRKQTVVYYFTENVEGVDIGALIEGGQFFEFYDIDYDETAFEKLPTPTKYIYTCSDLDQQARKRLERFSVVLNTRGGSVRFTAFLDGVAQSPVYFNSGDNKKTHSQYFSSALTFVNLCWELKSMDDIPFEYFGFLQPERLEVLPEPVKFLPIPATNLGNDKRKRFITYAIVIDTFGADCTLTLYTNENMVDSSTFSTTGKQTYIHYFTSETLGTDIRAELSCDIPFEFYELNFDETISEVLPAPAKYLVIPPSNLGIAAKKRLRTIPFVIHTRGGSVRFTPSVDGTNVASSDHTTTEKRTVLHYATTDLFGIDYGGVLESLDDTPFEFYGLERPENVQTLPVGKKYDQVGPLEVYREAWLRSFETRIVATGTSITYEVFAEDVSLYTGTINTTADVDKTYKVDIPKSIRGTIFRIEFSSADVFHRYHTYMRYKESGGQTEQQVAKFGSDEI